MFKHFLIPTDGSPASNKAAKAGIALAFALGARITAYYALEERQPVYDARFHKDLKMNEELEKRAREEGQKHVGVIDRMAKAAGVRCAAVVAKAATPYLGIIGAAKKQKCDVIFIASHGRSGLSRLIMGSVTQKVLCHSKIPVVVYR